GVESEGAPSTDDFDFRPNCRAISDVVNAAAASPNRRHRQPGTTPDPECGPVPLAASFVRPSPVIEELRQHRTLLQAFRRARGRDRAGASSALLAQRPVRAASKRALGAAG